jgi:hypothetical protein
MVPNSSTEKESNINGFVIGIQKVETTVDFGILTGSISMIQQKTVNRIT